MNKTILIGNITKDIETRITQSKKSVVEFAIAINENYGENKTTEYINIVAWEKLADNIAKYCSKGSKVAIEGKIKTDKYEKNGQTIYRTYVLANSVEFLQSKSNNEIKQAVSNVEFENDELPFL